MKNNPTPTYLPIEPTGIDRYEGKPQDRVAGPIAAVLESDKFKLIGLDGTWGAGKSNVICILQNRLKVTHHFFIYDAWSHQEDLQRRAFLEEFIDDLIINKLIGEATWKANLKDLLAKKKTTNTRTIPKFNPAYYAIILTVLLFFVSKPVSEMIGSNQPWWRLGVNLLPAIGLLIAWGIAAGLSPQYRDIPTMLAIYKEKELERDTSEVISENEPSVKQFRDWMTKVSQALGTKKVVVVFDNMDRLPADKVKALWSAIQTFVSEAKDHYPQITFIVPFDRTHIGKAFGGPGDQADVNAEHFINKTFPVIFNVALPSLTGWKGLFKLNMAEAFGNIPPTEYEQTESIFDLYNTTITPRKIIAFINDLVTLKVIWNEEIAIRYMALFVAARKEIMEDPLNQILKRTFAAKAELYFKGDDELPKTIAALVYNVPIEAASQVSLFREIQLSFRVRNIERIKELYLHPDFLTVLRKMIPGPDLSIEDYVLSLTRLEENINSESIKTDLKSIWSLLAGKLLMQHIPLVIFEEYYRILLQKLVGDDKFWPLVTHLVDSFYVSSSNDGAAYFNSLSALESILKEQNLEGRLLNILRRKDVTPDYYLSYVDAGKAAHKRFKIFTNPTALDTTLMHQVNTDFEHFQAVPYFSQEYELPQFRRRLEEFLSDPAIDASRMYPAFLSYRHVSKDRPVKMLPSDATVAAFLQRTGLDPKLFSELLAIKIVRSGSVELSTLPTSSMPGDISDAVVDGVAQVIETYRPLGELIKVELDVNDPVARSVLRQRILSPSSDSIVHVYDLFKDFQQIQQHFGVAAEELFHAFDTWHKLDNRFIPVKELPIYVPDMDLLALAFEQPANQFAQDILSIAQEYMITAEASDWNHSFSGVPDYLFQLTMVLLSNGIADNMPLPAQIAFREAILKIAHGQYDIPEARAWFFLYDRSDKHQIAPTLLNIRDYFINSLTLTSALFVFFERMLREHGHLEQRSDDVIRTILLPMINDPEAVQCINSNQPYYLHLLDHAHNPAARDFVRVVRDTVENTQASAPLQQLDAYLDANLYTPIEIVEARYRSINDPKKSIDVTDLVKRKVLEEHKLHFRVTNESMGNDPDFGTTKKLWVKLRHNDRESTVECNENGFCRLPHG